MGKMKRPVVVSALAAAQFVSGCAAQQTWLVPGDDPDKLVAAIAKQGQSHAPSEAAPPDSSVVADVVTTGAKVGETCLVFAACLVYGWGRGHPDGDCVGNLLH